MNTLTEVLDAYAVKHNKVEQLKAELEQAKKRLDLFDKILACGYSKLNNGTEPKNIESQFCVMRADGQTCIGKGSDFYWSKTGADLDIIAYKYI